MVSACGFIDDPFHPLACMVSVFPLFVLLYLLWSFNVILGWWPPVTAPHFARGRYHYTLVLSTQSILLLVPNPQIRSYKLECHLHAFLEYDVSRSDYHCLLPRHLMLLLVLVFIKFFLARLGINFGGDESHGWQEVGLCGRPTGCWLLRNSLLKGVLGEGWV